jgi:hypothetical protein
VNLYFLVGLLVVSLGMGAFGNAAATKESDRKRKRSALVMQNLVPDTDEIERSA